MLAQKTRGEFSKKKAKYFLCMFYIFIRQNQMIEIVQFVVSHHVSALSIEKICILF